MTSASLFPIPNLRNPKVRGYFCFYYSLSCVGGFWRQEEDMRKGMEGKGEPIKLGYGPCKEMDILSATTSK